MPASSRSLALSLRLGAIATVLLATLVASVDAGPLDPRPGASTSSSSVDLSRSSRRTMQQAPVSTAGGGPAGHQVPERLQPPSAASVQVEIPEPDPDLPLPEVPIVFVSRNRMRTLDGHYVGPPLDIPGREYTPGGRLLVWYPDGRLVDLTSGSRIYDVQQPDVSFDGRRIVFSGVEQDKGQWYLYEIGIDGSGLRQLTGNDRGFSLPVDPLSPRRNESVFGRFGDFGPAYLPDGRIMFVSTRYPTASASCGFRGLNLYVLDPATGQYWRRTTLRSGAIDPSVMSNGAIVYAFWFDLMSVPALDGPGLRPLETDYNFAPSFWGIWSIYPDGTNNGRIVFAAGGLSDYGGLYQPRELPDGDLVATVRGSAGLLGDTLANAITRVQVGLVPPRKLRFVGDPVNLEAPHALNPAPLPDGRIAFSYTVTPTLEVDWLGNRYADYDFGLYLLDQSMERLRPIYNDPSTDELDAVAVYRRSAPVIPDVPDAELISDDPNVSHGLTALLINRNVYADLPLHLVDVPSPKAGSVARVDVYDDSQVFTTAPGFPSIVKQMPRFVGSFPVDATGAFTAVVPTDRALMYFLVNNRGVPARSLRSATQQEVSAPSVVHYFGHDYLRPHGDFVCTGCHRGHMIDADEGMRAQANLARLAKASASSARDQFYTGAWRATDLRLADGASRWAWATEEGPGAWIELTWPSPIVAQWIQLYPLRSQGCRVTHATLELSDGTVEELSAPPVDGTPQVVPLEPPRTISWLRVTIDESTSRLVGLAEIVVNGPPDVRFPDVPPPPPTNLAATQGAIRLTWSPSPDPTVSGYTIHYGSATGQLTQTVDVGDVSSFVMQDRVSDGQTYYFAAKAYNLMGTESLAYSNEVTATARAPIVLSIEPNEGSTGGNTPVTIKGQHFSPLGVRVTIGSHAQAVKFVDTETITARTRFHGPGAVDVIVANVDDQVGMLAKGFTFVRPERPPQRAGAVHLPALFSGRR